MLGRNVYHASIGIEFLANPSLSTLSKSAISDRVRYIFRSESSVTLLQKALTAENAELAEL